MQKKHYLLAFLLIYCLPFISVAQQDDGAYVREHYTKTEKLIPMRDGTKLFTVIYQPKHTKEKFPILLNRTPYTVAPYGEEYKKSLGNFPAMMKAGYIFVYQDVRGKWMSEGNFEDIRPTMTPENNHSIDESTDTYDTIDWLLKNLKNTNGNVGIYGISYPGFYATASLINAHPALKAVSPQAPVTDWYRGDDFHHRGALFLTDAFRFMSTFGVERPKPILPAEGPPWLTLPTKDIYRFFLEAGSIKNLKDRYFGNRIKFWNDLEKHPDLDSFWTAREILRHVKQVKPAVLVVGGLFDAEDAYGLFETYKSLNKQSPKNHVSLVAGPWYHGGWVRSEGSSLGDIQFEQQTSKTYQEKFELPFFEHYLKGKGSYTNAEATVFISGSNQWKEFTNWPPNEIEFKKLYLQAQGGLSFEPVARTDSWDEYVSDPNKPVPHQGGVLQNRTREYMIDDQRFAANRPDVQVYQTSVLTEDITLAGPLKAHLRVSTSGTDADYVVKLIDVYPEDAPNNPGSSILMAGYQMLVRGEIMRGKYRDNFSQPKAMEPGLVTTIAYELPDVGHTFKKGHRIMVQIQNSWFPLADRNPQKFMNIYEAQPSDFQKATHRIFHDRNNSSYIELPILK
ncbi:CocE/NonD family hydrolase [Sphingobacteriaceae bacterium WQ 2009]|uniref:CocE/NonD family hydrolase n=1 Tax=Rhinopithecimicrobium faecis TaxID=2820698 RepID=A0A8T4HGC3_9SPHI|nr:CocE/NonD family hydrolase [Sphingobacteriaceae bacterium WQ 2009]